MLQNHLHEIIYILMSASQNGHIATVAALIAGGANVNAEDSHGEMALMWASRNGRTATVAALIVLGANVEATKHRGWTALMLASQNGRTATAAIIEMGLKGLQDTCKERDDGISGMFPGCMHNSSLKNIIHGYDCDPELEDILPVSVLGLLKDSVEKRKISGQTSGKSSTGSSSSSSSSPSSSSPRDCGNYNPVTFRLGGSSPSSSWPSSPTTTTTNTMTSVDSAPAAQAPTMEHEQKDDAAAKNRQKDGLPRKP